MAPDFKLPTNIVAVEASVTEAARAILSIARATLSEQGIHFPTAILHTLEGLFPILVPFKTDEQKRGLVDYVKTQALERHAYAVSMVTCAHIVDSRTGKEKEAVVVGTTVQGGQPYIVLQYFSRDGNGVVTAFEEVLDGDDAAMPGQMLIYPDWDEEVRH
ncbi:MAG: hypothetical protein RDU20_04520 [Desulfomonilaceae bacterium]|nr:hypothetical protein [Desulfomonilaceae bacterium]